MPPKHTKASSEFPDGICPKCGKSIILLTGTNNVARHNTGWREVVPGYSVGVSCKGSGKPARKAS